MILVSVVFFVLLETRWDQLVLPPKRLAQFVADAAADAELTLEEEG